MSKDDGKESDNLVFKIGDIVASYKIIEKIDEGGFGQVFKVTKDNKTYAMKIESSAMEGGSAIKLEIDVLVDLQSRRVSNFPAFVAAGRREKYHYLVMELLGENLKSLRNKAPKPDVLSVGTWTRLGIQCLYVVKLLHDNGFVHRDIKPANFAMGRSDAGVLRGRMVFLFDFGLARRYVLKKKEVSIGSDRERLSLEPTGGSGGSADRVGQPNRKDATCLSEERKSGEGAPSNNQYKFRIARPHTDFRGTAMYASLNAHNRLELGRADDLISLLYMISEMTSLLPWDSNFDDPVEDQKRTWTFEKMFKMPQFARVDENFRNCNYYMAPDYDLIYNIFKSLLDKSGTRWNDPYDWETDQPESYKKWKMEMTKTRTIYPWEDPKDFFRVDPWKNLARPKMAVGSSREKDKKCEKSGELKDKKMSPPGAVAGPAGLVPTVVCLPSQPAPQIIRNSKEKSVWADVGNDNNPNANNTNMVMNKKKIISVSKPISNKLATSNKKKKPASNRNRMNVLKALTNNKPMKK